MPEQDALRATHFIYLQIQGPAFVKPCVVLEDQHLENLCGGCSPNLETVGRACYILPTTLARWTRSLSLVLLVDGE